MKQILKKKVRKTNGGNREKRINGIERCTHKRKKNSCTTFQIKNTDKCKTIEVIVKSQ